ncbi:unnamed protein product, partial [Mesorhabditis belari]|uniref:Medium-chain acyl-CoA ligase ACSF2, mitochondrial n=1 Tax=Mesorhabditis belari TaxID=2138241 RepID=A0AAF3FRC2_9BILA
MKRSYFLYSGAKKISYVHQASSIPFLNETIGQRFRKSTEKNPDRIYCIFSKQNVKKSYEKLYEESYRLASSLIALGLRPGDRVGMWGPNYYEWIQTHFACAQAGFVLVNVNPFYRVPELEYALKKVGVKALVTPSSYRNSQYYGSVTEIIPELVNRKPGDGEIKSHLLPNLKHLIVFDPNDKSKKFNGAWNLEDLSTGAGSEADRFLKDIQSKINYDDPFNVQFTSGTTGSPKAVTLTHFSILNNANFIGLNSNFDKTREVICVPNPLYHAFGCVAGLLTAVAHSQTLLFPSETFSAAAALPAIEKEKATFIYGTPTMFIDILNHEKFEKTDVSSVSGGYISAAPIPKPLMERMLEKLNMHRIQVLYGCTEASPVITTATLQQTPQDRIKNSGYTMDHSETAIINQQSGLPVPRGEQGELVTRGYHVMRGYWGDEEKTKEAIDVKRWYHTGDIAVMADDGAISIVGRLKDMIIRGGENVYPAEIETTIFRHPAVADVHVIGVPDVRLGEEICAWIRLKDGKTLTADELIDYCKDKMARHSIPRYILFKKEHDFPLTATGKVQKFELRSISKKELGLEDANFKLEYFQENFGF